MKGNDRQIQTERIQTARFSLLMSIRDPEPWPIKVIKPPIIARPRGIVSLGEYLIERYMQDDRKRGVLAALMLMAGRRDEVVNG